MPESPAARPPGAQARQNRSARAKELAARAANANVLPVVTYAFVRQKAWKMAEGQA